MLKAHIKAAGHAGQTLVPAWAAIWGVAEQTVRVWYDETEHTGVVGAGDLNALEHADLLALLERWIETVRATISPPKPATDPRLIALSCATLAGDIARTSQIAMANDECDAQEWAAIEAQLEQGERNMRDAKLAARAAREQKAGL